MVKISKWLPLEFAITKTSFWFLSYSPKLLRSLSVEKECWEQKHDFIRCHYMTNEGSFSVLNNYSRVYVRDISTKNGRFQACIRNFFITFRATIFFSFVTYICCAYRGDFRKLLRFFFSYFWNCEHSCVLLFSARISLTLFLEGASKRSIAYAFRALFLKVKWCSSFQVLTYGEIAVYVWLSNLPE